MVEEEDEKDTDGGCDEIEVSLTDDLFPGDDDDGRQVQLEVDLQQVG